MPDLEQEIRDVRPTSSEVPPLDVDALHRRARRRRRGRAAGGATVVIAVIVGAGLAAQVATGPRTVRIDELVGGLPTPVETAPVGSEVATDGASPGSTSYRLRLLREAVEDQIAETARERDQLLAEIAVLEEQLSEAVSEGAEPRRDQLQDQIDQLRVALRPVEERLARLHQQLEEVETQARSDSPRMVVPDVVGLTENEAREQLEQYSMEPVTFTKATDDPELVGRVIDQSPSAGVAPTLDGPDGVGDGPVEVVIQVGVELPTPSNDPSVTGWFSDEQREADGRQDGWVAAWFAPDDAGALPEAEARWWRHAGDDPLTTPEQAELAVASLDDPPPGALSAFAGGLTVRDVSLDGAQVLVDLDGDSPGLHGHGSFGLILGSDQLVRIADHYYPDAETLCVAYDGTPTSTAAEGPSFLHDAHGCPIDLP